MVTFNPRLARILTQLSLLSATTTTAFLMLHRHPTNLFARNPLPVTLEFISPATFRHLHHIRERTGLNDNSKLDRTSLIWSFLRGSRDISRAFWEISSISSVNYGNKQRLRICFLKKTYWKFQKIEIYMISRKIEIFDVENLISEHLLYRIICFSIDRIEFLFIKYSTRTIVRFVFLDNCITYVWDRNSLIFVFHKNAIRFFELLFILYKIIQSELHFIALTV